MRVNSKCPNFFDNSWTKYFPGFEILDSIEEREPILIKTGLNTIIDNIYNLLMRLCINLSNRNTFFET